MEKIIIRNFRRIRNGFGLFLVAVMVACSGQTTKEVVDEDVTAATDEIKDEGNGTLEYNNFNTLFSSTSNFEDWDANDDNFLDENEFNNSFYNTWDTNSDKKLDENEWNKGANSYGLANETWSGWNTSGDDMLDENEFRTSLKKNNYYHDWDLDKNKMLNEREYSDGVFSLWDDNDDGILDNKEYANYNTFYEE